MVGDQAARDHLAIDAGRETRLMIADQIIGRRRRSGELFGVQVATAGDAVNVSVLVGCARRLSLELAFGEALFSLHLGGTKPKLDARGQARSALSSAKS